MINDSIINRAIKTAKQSNVKRAKVAALLVTNKGHILTAACNRRFYGAKGRFTIHAEEAVIARSTYYIKRYTGQLTLIVIRVRPNGKFAISKPCDRCQKLINQTPFKVIYHDGKGFK